MKRTADGRSKVQVYPKWWEEVPDVAEYFDQSRPRREWSLDDKGYCKCSVCTRGGKDEHKLVYLRDYKAHCRDERRERRKQAQEAHQQNTQTPFDASSPEQESPQPAEGTAPPMPQDFVRLGVGEHARSNEEVPVIFDLSADRLPSDSSTQSTFAHGQDFDAEPAAQDQTVSMLVMDDPIQYEAPTPGTTANSTYFQHIIAPGWTDFFDQFVDLARPVENCLQPVPCFQGKAPPKLDVLEHVLYSTGMALGAQWHVPQAAIQFALTQMYNTFRYGQIVGRHNPNPMTPQPILDIAEGAEGLFSSGSTATGVRTFRGLQRHLDPDLSDLAVVHAACTYEHCRHVFYNITHTSEFKTGSTCSLCKKPPDKASNIGLVPFPRIPLATALKRFFENEGVEELCEQADMREAKSQEWDRVRHGQKIYRQATSGSAWRVEGLSEEPSTDIPNLIIVLAFGLDYYQASRSGSARLQSIGPMLAHVTNLPVRMRGNLKLALLLGITPGPKDITRGHLYHYLLPLAAELRHARLGGLTIATPKYPRGRKIYVHVGTLCCDAPARCMVTGGPWHTRWGTFCIRCGVMRDDLINDGPMWKVVNTAKYTAQVYAERRRVRTRLAEETEKWNSDQIPIIARRRNGNTEPQPFPKKRKEEIISEIQRTPGHPTAFDIVPFLDKFHAASFDPVHMLCTGIIPRFFKGIMFVGNQYPKGKQPTEQYPRRDMEGCDDEEEEAMNDGSRRPGGPAVDEDAAEMQAEETEIDPASAKDNTQAAGDGDPGTASKGQSMFTPKQRDWLHDLMAEVRLPPKVDPITAHTFFLGESGGNTAAQWRTFARHYASFVLIEMWTVKAATAKGNKSSRLDPDDLEPLLLVAEITDLALRQSISEKQIATLRLLIKRLQDISYRDRPTIYRCSNLHWLSHLPDDIERNGPVYSWWLFAFERINKLLKMANLNGHASETPLIAMNQFLREAMLERLATFKPSGYDLGAAYFAAKSNEAFREALNGINMTEEQKAARTWTEERVSSEPQGYGPNRLEETVMEVLQRRDDILSIVDRELIRAQWNSNPASRYQVRLHRSAVQNQPPQLVLPLQATCWTEFYINQNYFRLPSRKAFPVNNIAISDLGSYDGAFFEWRSDKQVFDCVCRPVYVGIMEGVYEIEASNGADKESRRFMKLHLLMPYTGADPYNFKERVPTMNIWLFEPQIVKTVIQELRLGDVDGLRPVVLKPMPLDPSRPQGLKLFSIRGINHRG